MNLFDNFINQHIKEYNITIKNIFRGEIDASFLIKTLHNIFSKLKLEDFNQYYHLDFSFENHISNHNPHNFDYDICKMIIGVHKSNMIFLDKIQQKKLQDSSDYQNKLVKSVIENIYLRRYGSYYFRNNQIMSGDRFLYFQVPYDLFVICMKMKELLINNPNKLISYSIINKITDMGLSALSLLENNYLEDVYSVCRGIIELYLSLICLHTNKNIMKEYEYLSNIESQYSRCNIPLPDDFHQKHYNNRINQEQKEIHSFLHYGWVDKIPDYHKIVKRRPYSITGIFKYILQKENIDLSNLENLYNMCHSYTHANIIQCIYPLNHYFETSIMLYITLKNTYTTLCSYLKCDTFINDIDIITKIDTDFKQLLEQYSKRNTENFNKYYNINK